MFKKLFGGGSAPASAPAKPAPVDPQVTIDRLEQQVATIGKRIVVMENKFKDAKAMALAKKKAGDQRGAVMALKQMKMYGAELTKLDGQQIMLTQQQMTIQSTHADVDVVNTLKAGNQAITSMNKQMEYDSIAELQDEMQDQMDQVAERQALFANAAEEGKDDLLAELDELEAEAIEGEMDMDLGPMNPIAAPKQKQAVHAQAEEEKLAADLMAMMQ